MMTQPPILKEDLDTIVKEIKGKIPFYTPEWTFGDENDFGAALSQIYAHLAEIIIKRLNEAPQKHFLSFLDTINVPLLPAQPSRVPLTFVISSGAPNNVLIPALTQASASGAEGEEILFETEKNILATPSSLVSIFSTVKKDGDQIYDQIFDHKRAIDGSGETTLFNGDNLQEHILYIGDKDLLNVNVQNARILITIDDFNQAFIDYCEWAYAVEVETEEGSKEIEWNNFNNVTKENDNAIALSHNKDESIPEVKIGELQSRWIQCKVRESQIDNVDTVDIKSLDISTSPSVSEGIIPKLAFYNDIPIDINQDIYPFGMKPQVGDIFYLASEDAFSKKGYDVTITFKNLLPGKPSCDYSNKNANANEVPVTFNTPYVSWEYWDGESWSLLDEVDEDFASDGCCTLEVKRAPEKRTFTISPMPEVKPLEINGKESYWIRVRLIEGDYGRNFEFIYRKDSEKNEIKPAKYCPPQVGSIKITYEDNQQSKGKPEYLLTKNNLTLEEIKTSFTSFKPFIPLPDENPTVYFGFYDRPLKDGPLSFFFNIDGTVEYPEDFLPLVKWQLLSDNSEAVDLEVLDETRGLMKSGTVKFSVSEEMKGLSRFGSQTEQFWLRTVFTGEFFKREIDAHTIIEKSQHKFFFSDYMKFLSLRWPEVEKCEKLKSPLLITASETPATGEELKKQGIFCPSFMDDIDKKRPPHIFGFYMNTVWASQTITISDEIAGTSNGEREQTFTLVNAPVIEETIWVNELNALSEGEKDALKDNAQKITDDRGNVLEFWVKWESVPDFFDSHNRSRHYIIDSAGGEIQFGNGLKGAVPPLGANIKATYKTGGGKSGNLDAHTITTVKSALAFVDEVFNPVISDGGTDTEERENLIVRGPVVLKHRNRAVTLEDYEWLAREASNKVVRVKVIPNMDDTHTPRTGWVLVVIVPESSEIKPKPSPELLNQVETYLEAKGPNVATIKVIQPCYIRVNVEAEIMTKYLNELPLIEQKARKGIVQFLHPLTGAPDGKGWPFGAVPCLSDIYTLFEGIESVDYVKTVKLYLETEQGSKIDEITESSDVITLLSEYALIFSGNHSIKVTWNK